LFKNSPPPIAVTNLKKSGDRFLNRASEIEFFNNVISEISQQQNIPSGAIRALEARKDLQLMLIGITLSPAWEKILTSGASADAILAGFNLRPARTLMELTHKSLAETFYQAPVAEVHSTDLITTPACNPLGFYCITVFSQQLFKTEKDWRDETELELTRSVAKSIKASFGRGPQYVRATLLDNYAVYIISGLIADNVLACPDPLVEFHYRQSINYILAKALDDADIDPVQTGPKNITINWPENKIIIVAPLTGATSIAPDKPCVCQHCGR